MGLNEEEQRLGYYDFLIDYTKSSTAKSNIYKCCGKNFGSNYDELVGRYYTVIETLPHPKSIKDEYLYGKKYFLKLVEKQSLDTMYYEYDGEFEHSFPFMLVSYFIKLQKTSIGKEYIVRGKNWSSNEKMFDIDTGSPIQHFEVGSKWKCIDVTVEEGTHSLCLVLKNNKEEKILINSNYVKGNDWVFEYKTAESYKKKFGNDNWNKILEGKVSIGMSSSMCLLSWGKPLSINETIRGGSKSEQWVYPENYLYFNNSVLRTIQ